jgi:hypothetical protein
VYKQKLKSVDVNKYKRCDARSSWPLNFFPSSSVEKRLETPAVDYQHGQQAYRRMAHLSSSNPKLTFAQQLLSGYLAVNFFAF